MRGPRVLRNAARVCTCVFVLAKAATRKFREPIRREFIEFTKFDTGIILVLSRDFKRSRDLRSSFSSDQHCDSTSGK